MNEAILTIAEKSISHRPFFGLGAQMDAYIFDEVNRQCGVNDEDLELIARRVRAIQPSVSRLFVDVRWFNPSLDGQTLIWDQPEFGHLVRQLRLLQETGTQVNLVLFQPLLSVQPKRDPVIRSMIKGIEQLIAVEGFTHLRWLTLWNEPEAQFQYDSPLFRQVFGPDALNTRPPRSEYVRLNRLAYQQLAEHKLDRHVKLMVCDAVYGAPMRRECMQLCVEEFGDLNVAYGYHNYNPEDLSFYHGNEAFAYAGMEAEAATFREILGPDRELMLWEFNTAGLAGFNAYFTGVGPHGEDRICSVKGAVDVADKVLATLSGGGDGCSLWCMHDLIHGGHIHRGVMPCGLWRFKWQQWLPRPIYHYFAPLMIALRPGSKLHHVQGCSSGVRALAAVAADGRTTLAVLNNNADTVTAHLPINQPVKRRRISPELLPIVADLPLSNELVQAPVDHRITLELKPSELSIVTLDVPIR